jgi:2-amino-4-hydroxy-6-hydroxymethyldihydropteridine diphosphokinase
MTGVMAPRPADDAPSPEALGLPPWQVTTARRRAHIGRVVALLESWAGAMRLAPAEAAAWRDAGRWHDALRDAPAEQLRPYVDDPAMPAPLLHGPAAATRLAAEGESRADVLDAIRWHTTGRRDWGRTAQALYMADYLEPGRPFDNERRALLAARVPEDFTRTLHDVVRERLIWSLREGKALHPESVALWNAIR